MSDIRNLSTEEIYNLSNLPVKKENDDRPSFVDVFNEIREYHSDFPLTVNVYQDMNYFAHWHDEFEIVRVLDGSIVLGINSERRTLLKGDVAFLISGDIHYYESINSKTTVMVVVFRPSLIQDVVNELKKANVRSLILAQNTTEAAKQEQIHSILDLIQVEFIGKLPSYEIMIKGQLLVFLCLLVRCFSNYFLDNYQLKNGDNKTVTLIQEAIRYINLNYTSDLTLSSISNFLNVSTFYFSRQFKAQTGVSFKDYINGIRINKACQLLGTTNWRIIDITYESGFNSLRTFNRIFRKINGISPSNYRRSIAARAQ
ncbi:MAG: helix-turn-helix domain-containing protein [Saccharofermentanales bacterium]|jgi:AraC-like DNA-binding protein/quercetin dioxygenase-like cupin family protein